MQSTPAGYVSISDAAHMIGQKPWDVVRLIEAGEVKSVELVEVASLAAHRLVVVR